jgi:hypothetical protein
MGFFITDRPRDGQRISAARAPFSFRSDLWILILAGMDWLLKSISPSQNVIHNETKRGRRLPLRK